MIDVHTLAEENKTQSVTKLAKKYGVNHQKIQRLLKNAGYLVRLTNDKRTKKQGTLPDGLVLIAEYQNLSLSQLAKKYGVTASAVRYKLVRTGQYKPRGYGERTNV